MARQEGQGLGFKGLGLTCEVEAVGMGATSSELRTPWAAMSRRRPSQSHRVLGAFTPHMSCCSCPLLTGLPSYVS